jgi:hypothetical protein
LDDGCFVDDLGVLTGFVIEPFDKRGARGTSFSGESILFIVLILFSKISSTH